MKYLLFMTVVMMGICETGNGMLSEFKCDFVGASDLSAIISEVNIAKKHISPDRVFQLKSSIIEKQRVFASMHQDLLVARCKFIQAMLMVHGEETVPSQYVLSRAAALLLEAAEEGDTDAQEVVFTSTGKGSMRELKAFSRDAILDSVKKRITSPVIIKEDFLRQYMLKGVIDKLASIAADDESCDISSIIPLSVEGIDDSILTKRRDRFQLLLGSMLSLLEKDDLSKVSNYITGLDQRFQQLQVAEFGISAYADIELRSSLAEIISDRLLHTTGGLPEMLATTPDIAFSKLKDSRLQDFKIVVNFIKTVRLVARKNTSVLSEVVNSLLIFSDKWNDYVIASYLRSSELNFIVAKEYMKSIREIIEGLK